MFGGTPEQLALARAQEEAQARRLWRQIEQAKSRTDATGRPKPTVLTAGLRASNSYAFYLDSCVEHC